MDRHLRVARRLHLGARRRGRCRSGPSFCRDRVRYLPSVQCTPFPPAHLPRPVRGNPLRAACVDAVGLTVRLAPALCRAPAAARVHRGAGAAEHGHPRAPTTSPESTFHALLRLLGAAGRAARSASRSHAAASTRLPRRPGGPSPGPSPSPSRGSTPSAHPRPSTLPAPPRRARVHARHDAHHRPSTGGHRFSVSPPRPPLGPPEPVGVARATRSAVTTTDLIIFRMGSERPTSSPWAPAMTISRDQLHQTSSESRAPS
jgi:hypothetical protein